VEKLCWKINAIADMGRSAMLIEIDQEAQRANYESG
jgi:hypothetical protein